MFQLPSEDSLNYQMDVLGLHPHMKQVSNPNLIYPYFSPNLSSVEASTSNEQQVYHFHVSVMYIP